ncbi:unnamed protein product [Sphagnum troendelagicum]|uniref:Uncharacterized protein n=1 Tax=Sphagnum troendelagicum TaxID=128251 RepID=A0ABP0V1Q5_9BRYO
MMKESVWLLEESFQSFPNYKRVLFATLQRVRDRVLARANVQEEMEIKAWSGSTMKQTLNWWDLMWFGVGSVIGAGNLIITVQESKGTAGPVIIISYCTCRILCHALSFATLNSLLRSLLRSLSLIETNLTSGYNQLDPIAIGILIATGAVAIWSTKGTSYLNWVATFVNMLILIFVIIAGLAHAKAENYKPFLCYSVRGIFSAASVLFFAYLGFDAVLTMAKETKNTGQDIPIGLLGSMTIFTVLYVLMALTLCSMVPTPEIDQNAPYSVAFQTVGMSWVKYVVALGALKGITTVLLVGAVGQA